MTQPSTAHAAKVIGVTVAAAVGGFLFGFDSSVINGAVDSIEDDFALSAFVTGFAVAIALLGCAVGAWFAGRLADRWGRKRVMLLGAVLFFVSLDRLRSRVRRPGPDALAGARRTRHRHRVGHRPGLHRRDRTGPIRGRLGSLQQLAITLGIFAALLSDALLADAAGGASNDLWFGLEAWRWMFLVGDRPGCRLRHPRATDPRVAALPGGAGRDEEAAEVLADVTGEPEPRRTGTTRSG